MNFAKNRGSFNERCNDNQASLQIVKTQANPGIAPNETSPAGIGMCRWLGLLSWKGG